MMPLLTAAPTAKTAAAPGAATTSADAATDNATSEGDFAAVVRRSAGGGQAPARGQQAAPTGPRAATPSTLTDEELADLDPAALLAWLGERDVPVPDALQQALSDGRVTVADAQATADAAGVEITALLDALGMTALAPGVGDGPPRAVTPEPAQLATPTPPVSIGLSDPAARASLDKAVAAVGFDAGLRSTAALRAMTPAGKTAAAEAAAAEAEALTALAEAADDPRAALGGDKLARHAVATPVGLTTAGVALDPALAATSEGTAPLSAAVDTTRFTTVEGQTVRQALASARPQEQIALSINQAVQDGKTELRIQLQPAELGRVQIQLDMTDGKWVSARITAEMPETLELLQRDARNLERLLRDSGLQLGDAGLQFGQNHQQGQRDDADTPFAATHLMSVDGPENAAISEAPPATLTLPQAGQRLDIRA